MSITIIFSHFIRKQISLPKIQNILIFIRTEAPYQVNHGLSIF